MTTASNTAARSSRAVVIAVVVTVTAWASAFIAIRAVKDSFEPGALAMGRLLVGSIALGAAVASRRRWIRPSRGD